MSAVLSMFIDSIRKEISKTISESSTDYNIWRITAHCCRTAKVSKKISAKTIGTGLNLSNCESSTVTALGYSFADFLTNTGLIAGIALIAIIIFFFFAFKKELTANKDEKIDPSTFPAKDLYS